MKILIKLLFVGIFLISVILMLQISWEIGLSFLVMFTATSCIWIVLKRITKVIFYPDLKLSSEPFRDSTISGGNETELVNKNISTSENLIPGVDASIFAQFREKLNLNNSSGSAYDSMSSVENSKNLGLVAEAYENSNNENSTETFSNELEDIEQVKVTLSEEAKNRQEEPDEVYSKNTFEDQNEDGEEKQKVKNAESQKAKNRKNEETVRKIGMGEEALKILSRKHQALRRQTRDISTENQEEFEEDLFADELIPIPGGETLKEPNEREFSDDDLFTTFSSADSKEIAEGLSSSLRKKIPMEEKNIEAEGLLKIATTACKAGRMEEARVSLTSYLDLLKELGQKPSSDVLQLAEKLKIPFDGTQIEKLDLMANKKQEENLQNESEQTNYESVMDGIVKTLEEKESYEEALPLLKDLLNYNRQRVNMSAMDPLYERIERAHSSMQNDEELVAAYKEHLAIKQHLDDIEGELNLLELISEHYMKIGDMKASKRYKSEILRLKDGL